MKTFVKWSGNKSQHINKFKEYLPVIEGTYIEPFVGSGALFLYLHPEKWIINDLNKDLINIWSRVKDNPEDIIEVFKIFGSHFKDLSNKDKKNYCIDMTANIGELPYNLERATKFMLMKHCAYMGHILVKDKFNFAGLDLSISMNNRCFFLEENNYKNIQEVSSYLNKSKGTLLNGDYKKVLKKSKKGDFVFLDPPYIEEHEYQFNYNKGEDFSNFVSDLLKEVKKLDKKGVKWMMTQADTEQIRREFNGYNIQTFQVYRAITKSYKNELVIMNYVN